MKHWQVRLPKLDRDKRRGCCAILTFGDGSEFRIYSSDPWPMVVLEDQLSIEMEAE